MLRLVGVNIPEDKRIEYALTLIFGIGWTSAGQILKKAGIDNSKRAKELSEEELKKITQIIEKDYMIEGELREDRSVGIKRLKEISSYRGMRHAMGLPVRGQRTRSNARTKRGKRKTVGALSKEAWAKTDQSQTGGATAPTTGAKTEAPGKKTAGK